MNIREINVMHVIITILKYVIKMVRKTIEYSISNKFARGKVIRIKFCFKVSPFGRIYWLIQ